MPPPPPPPPIIPLPSQKLFSHKSKANVLNLKSRLFLFKFYHYFLLKTARSDYTLFSFFRPG